LRAGFGGRATRSREFHEQRGKRGGAHHSGVEDVLFEEYCQCPGGEGGEANAIVSSGGRRVGICLEEEGVVFLSRKPLACLRGLGKGEPRIENREKKGNGSLQFGEERTRSLGGGGGKNYVNYFLRKKKRGAERVFR